MLGVVAGNSATTILWRAFVVMIAGLIVGTAVGAISQRTVDDHIRRYKSDHPIPGEEHARTDDTAAAA